jgi:uncharacterized repeat protein (TIGR01451 family)
MLRNWLRRLSRARGSRPADFRTKRRPQVERLEDRTVPTVNINTNFVGLDFNSSSGGFVPPDTNGAAGPSHYVETVNQTLAIYTKTGSKVTSDGFADFFHVQGGLPPTTGSYSDPVVVYDELIQRFIVEDQELNTQSEDIAVSKTNDPTTLTSSNWNFYQIAAAETNEDIDYPGNIGYNADAVVITLNMFLNDVSLNHVQEISINASDLANGVSQANLHTFKSDISGASIRPATMHGSVTGDPMWMVTTNSNNTSIDVLKMTNMLSNTPTITDTNLAVTAYANVVAPLNPNGTVITSNIDDRIQKVSSNSGTLMAAHSVSNGSTEDDIAWYKIDVSSGTPALSDQGRVSAGNHTYLVYPAIDISSSGNIGMTFTQSGTDTSTDFMSMWVTGRTPSDSLGTMEAPVIVSAGTGVANYSDFAQREGDLSGISLDSDGTFWGAAEFANTEATANWGTAIANFALGSVVTGSADLAVALSGPGTAVEGDNNLVYTLTVTNSGPDDALGVTLTDTLGANLNFVSATTSQGSFTHSGGVVTFTLGTVPFGGTVTATVTAQAAEDGTLANSASATSSGTGDPNTGNNSASASTTVSEPPITVSGSPLSLVVTKHTKNVTNLTTATFTHANGVEPTSAFTATISWGDGSQSTGTITLSGTTYTVKGSHTYKNAGTFSVRTRVSESGNGAQPVLEASAPLDPVQQTLTTLQLFPAVQAAIADWQAAGANTAQIALLNQVPVSIALLPNAFLGEEQNNQVWISPNAAGWGWYTDSSFASNRAFPAIPGSAAYGKMDLVSVVAHEFGHVLGLVDCDNLQDVMGETLASGVRRLPTANDLLAGTSLTKTSLPSADSASASSTNAGNRQLADLLAGIQRVDLHPTLIGSANLTAAPLTSDSALPPPSLLGAVGRNSATVLPSTSQLPARTTTLLDEVFATIAVKPLHDGIYQGLFVDAVAS